MIRLAGRWLWCALILCGAPSYAANILNNGSFESNLSYWTTNPSYPVQVVTSWSGVMPLAGTGNKFLVLPGAATVGYTYAQVISQSKFYPFGGDVPPSVSDNFVVYLAAYTYLHTNDGRAVSYALTVEPGYGLMSSTFYGGPQNSWVIAQTSGYYYARDPFDASSPVKPIKVTLELRDSLQSGEYLLLDEVWLMYGGTGVPEPSAMLALLAGMLPVAISLRRRRGR